MIMNFLPTLFIRLSVGHSLFLRVAARAEQKENKSMSDYQAQTPKYSNPSKINLFAFWMIKCLRFSLIVELRLLSILIHRMDIDGRMQLL